MDTANMQESVAEEVNRRLGRATEELVEKYARGEGGQDQSVDGPTGQAYKEKYMREAAGKRQNDAPSKDSGEDYVQGGAEDGEGGQDEDHELRSLRERRMRQLQRAQKEKIENLGRGHGQYREIAQDEFLAEVTNSDKVVCHFYHRDFPRCEIMNMHIEKLAPKHIEAKFIKINAEKTPFFVDKLKIRTIPSLILFHDGVAKDKILGFEGLADTQEEGKEDEWPTVRLARLLASKGMIRKDLIVDEEQVQQQKLEEMRRAIMLSTLNDGDDDDLSD
eukprot:gene6980-7723_t